MSLVLYFFYLIAAIVVGFQIFKLVTAPEEKIENGKVVFIHQKPPTPLVFYLKVVFSWSNLTKPGYLPHNKKIPQYEVRCYNAQMPESQVSKLLSVTGFDKSLTELPLTFPFATALPIAYPALLHYQFPMKSLAATIHIKQTISLLRPVRRDENISKLGNMGGGENTDRGSEFEAPVEIYSGSSFEKTSLIGRGSSFFLIVKKKKDAKNEPAPSVPKDLPPVTRTVDFKCPENIGRKYASGSGDYNPWHLYPSLAKMFGFRKTIAQGFWTLNRCIAEIGADLPKYPLKMETEWKRPVFLPSTVTLTVRKAGNKVHFELESQDKQHLHMVGVIEHVPDMKL